MNEKIFDIAIIGGGIVGLAAAVALAKNTSLRIAVIESKKQPEAWNANHFDLRVSAIALSSKNILSNLACWDVIAKKRISPYHAMTVWDEGGEGEISFAASAVHESELGYIIEDSVMRTSLFEQLQQYANVTYLSSVILSSIQEEIDSVLLYTNAQSPIKTKLLIAADGAESWVRKKAGIELKSWDYQHTAIVATVKTELPHQSTARQRFLKTGPLAFLPLSDPDTCSIVWSTSSEHAAELLEYNDEQFQQALSLAFENQLGRVVSTSSRTSFPLRMRHAKQYVKPRLALIGDAAHTIHPLAGQGVNMGLLDAICLAEIIIEAHQKNRNFASLATLRRYERWRKGDTLTMLAAIEALKQLFAQQHITVRYLRNTGLTLTNKIPFIKNFLANYALGKRGDLPKMAVQ